MRLTHVYTHVHTHIRMSIHMSIHMSVHMQVTGASVPAVVVVVLESLSLAFSASCHHTYSAATDGIATAAQDATAATELTFCSSSAVA